MSAANIQQGKTNTPIKQDPDKLNADPQAGSQDGSADDADQESDLDAAGDEDEEMNGTQGGALQMNDEVELTKTNEPSGSQELEVDPVTVQARARLRSRATLKKRMATPEDVESEEEDGPHRRIRASTESDEDGEDELDSDADPPRSLGKRAKADPGSATKKINTVQDLPMYAQHAYVASTYGLPKLPIPMVLLPGLRSRKPPPIPIPELTKRSRGRHVAAMDDDGRKYHCTVAGCDKRFARGEHLKRHIRSIHTHEKPHQCPYPGCLRGFSRTDNMMQHMRTHDDWPDDEAAAQLLAEAEKKSGKKNAAAGLPSDKDFSPFGPMMPFPWQMPPAFLKWAQQTGINPFIPFIPPPLPAGTSADDAMDLDVGLVLDPTASLDASAPTQQSAETADSNGLVPERQSGSPAPKDTSETAAGSPEEPPQAKGKKKNSKSKSKPSRGASKSTAASTSAPTSPVDTAPEASMDFSMAAGMMNSMPNMMNPMMPGMSPWGMPPGMQFPFMPMPPHMSPHMAPGMPFPPPAIAIPIPVGTPLPHPSQLPPNAQLIPDAKGGHTIIIPPPPTPWGMPFPPNMLPMPMLPSPTAPLAPDQNAEKSPST